MALFEPAFGKLKGFEGGYADDPDDAGRETYCGISRRFHPYWEGWRLIDALKSGADQGWRKAGTPELEVSVREFYRVIYWAPVAGDQIASQAVAEEVLDIAINVADGVQTAVRMMQRGLNALNFRGQRWADVAADGEIGPMTINAEHRCAAAGLGPALARVMNCQQGVYYLERVELDPIKEKFFISWLRRVQLA